MSLIFFCKKSEKNYNKIIIFCIFKYLGQDFVNKSNDNNRKCIMNCNEASKETLKLAAECINQNKFDEAINIYEELINKFPTNRKLKSMYYIALCKKSQSDKEYQTYYENILKLYRYLDFPDMKMFYGSLVLYFNSIKEKNSQFKTLEIYRKLKKEKLTDKDFLWLAKKVYILAVDTKEKTFYKNSILFLQKGLKLTKSKDKELKIVAKIAQIYADINDFHKSLLYLKYAQRYCNKKCDLFYIQKLLEKHIIISTKFTETFDEYKNILIYILNKYNDMNFKQYAWIGDRISNLGTKTQDKDFYEISVFFYKKAIKKSQNYKKCINELKKTYLIYFHLEKYHFAKGYIRLTYKYTKSKDEKITLKKSAGELYFLLKNYNQSINIYKDLLNNTKNIEKPYIFLKLAENYIAKGDIASAKNYINQAHFFNTTDQNLKEDIEKLYQQLM